MGEYIPLTGFPGASRPELTLPVLVVYVTLDFVAGWAEGYESPSMQLTQIGRLVYNFQEQKMWVLEVQHHYSVPMTEVL